MDCEPPDIAASAPPARPSRAKGSAAKPGHGRRRLLGWLNELGDIGVAFFRRMGAIVAERRAEGGAPGTLMAPRAGGIDLNLAWELVARAMRWTMALQARLKAEARAARAAQEPRESNFDTEDWHEDLLRPPQTRAMRAEPDRAVDRCVDAQPVDEVVAQICADLAAAAALIHEPELAAQIAAIARTARAFLAGPDAAWTPLPIARAPDKPAPATPAPATPGPAMPAPAPDTG